MKKLLVANWKMNKNVKECFDFFETFTAKFTQQRDSWIAPQSIHLNLAINLGKEKNIMAGAQNASEHISGAYTGEISPKSLKELGAHFVILGHSERREYFNETSKLLNSKIRTAINEGLVVIYCVGETLAQRESGQTLSIIEDQIHQGLNDLSSLNQENLVIAYEPIWAIGTGKTATPAEAQVVHAHIRKVISTKFEAFGAKTRILYGGSVKPDNVEELLGQKDIDGALVGGASLKATDFLALCNDK